MEGAKGLHDRDASLSRLTAFWVAMFTFQAFRRKKTRGFLDWLRKYWILKKGSALWSQIIAEETYRFPLQTATA